MVTVLTSLKKNKGFTLIELMLATSLLMMVLFSGYYAYSLYSQKWQKRVDVFWQGTEQGIGIDALNKLFISAVSYVVKNNSNKESIYFIGTKSTIRFISNSPLFSSGTALVELEVIREAEKDRLIYRENNLLNQPLFHLSEFENIIDWQKETVLFEEYDAIEWSFYGWTTFADALEQANIAENVVKRELRKQYKLHELEKIRVLPISIHLNLAKENSQSSFNIDFPNNTIYTLIANFRNDA